MDNTSKPALVNGRTPDEFEGCVCHNNSTTFTGWPANCPPSPNFYATGWVCPKCGRVYSPSAMMCSFCGMEEQKITYSTSTTPKA